MVPMFGTQSVTFWYPHDLPQSHTPVRPLNPYLPLSLTLKGRGGSARPSATIASHPRRPRVSIARPSDGPTDPSRRSRRTDPALEREINKIIKDDRRVRFLSPRLRGRPVCEKQLTPNKRGRRSPPSAQRRPTSVFLRVAPAT